MFLRQAARPDAKATWVLPVRLLPMAMTFSLRWMYFERASSITSSLFNVGMSGRSKAYRVFTAGKRAARMRLHNALVAVDEFQFGQHEQVLGMIRTLGGALRCPPSGSPEEAGQLQFLQMVFQQQGGPVVYAALPDSKVILSPGDVVLTLTRGR